jgi:hypothetical protein
MFLWVVFIIIACFVDFVSFSLSVRCPPAQWLVSLANYSLGAEYWYVGYVEDCLLQTRTLFLG